MEGVLAILFIFGGPVAILISRRYFAYREKLLELEHKRLEKGLLPAGKSNEQVEARLENLEAIVTSVDFELNQRLNRLALEASRIMPGLAAGPEARATPTTTAPLPPRGATLTNGPASPTPPTAPSIFAPGQRIADRYLIQSEIGRGGMGAVYLARDDTLGEDVALKTILTSLADDRSVMSERFRREVQAARRVTHGNVIRIHDLGEEGHVLFLSMEYIPGTTLQERVKSRGPITEDEARRVLQAIGDGVAAAHDVGVVHRDLKPHNVLLGDSQLVKVIDFGLASASFASDLTATGMIMGTPEYMAPEQIRGKACDERADVYALGALAYFVMCGRPPFVGATPIAVGFSQVHEEPVPPTEVRDGLPSDLVDATMRALAKDPADRFSNAREWRDALGK